MILTIDVGNTTIAGGLFSNEKLLFQFRKSTNATVTSDELGIFLRDVIVCNGFDYKEITEIACSSVVPAINHALSNAFVKYFGKSALFIQAGVKTGIKIKCPNPNEVGADRVAAAMGAVNVKPNTNLIVIDMGTATTVDMITDKKEYLGGAIMPGIAMSVRSLASGTAKLPSVEIVKPEKFYAAETISAIQAGIYYGHAGSIKEIIAQIKANEFKGKNVYIIGTGGFAKLYSDYGIFDEIQPDLVHQGLLNALKLNH
ncbi:MAG: type III pantothenate kinase [Treponema sp.]|nr:type III pantothenate kinase [Treponema sp.]